MSGQGAENRQRENRRLKLTTLIEMMDSTTGSGSSTSSSPLKTPPYWVWKSDTPGLEAKKRADERAEWIRLDRESPAKEADSEKEADTEKKASIEK
jgi:hypothetical protein